MVTAGYLDHQETDKVVMINKYPIYVYNTKFDTMHRLSITILLLNLCLLLSAQIIRTEIQDDAVYFMEGKDSILVYQIAEKSIQGAYAPSNYIHPLYSLNGQVITEDFPPDHLHQRGIFWAWRQLYVGDTRIGDGWEIKDFRWEVKDVQLVHEPDSSTTMQTEVLWKSALWLDADSNEIAVVREITHIKVYPANSTFRQIDFEIALYALEENMRIGGAENEKGYGGFSARIRLPNDMSFIGSNGIVEPHNLPVHAGGWMDFSGSIGKEGEISGISILAHQNNPGYPNPWILRREKSLQNAVYPFPGAEPVPLDENEPTVLRYRLLIHVGDVNSLDIPGIYEKYRKQ